MASAEKTSSEPAATVLAFALIYACFCLLVRLVVAGEALGDDFVGSYRMGAVLAAPGNLLVGASVGLLLFVRPDSPPRRVLTVLLGALLYGLHLLQLLPGAAGRSHLAFWMLAYVGISAIGTPVLARRLARRGGGRGAALANAIAVVALSTITGATVLEGSGPLWDGAAGPLVRMLGATDPGRAAMRERTPDDAPPEAPPEGVPPDVMAKVQGLTGVEEPTPIVDPRYPFCRAEAAPGRPTRARSVLLLLLENVGSRELAFTTETGPLMPRLAGIAGSGVHFERFLAVSEKSSDALLSSLSGLFPSVRPSPLPEVPLMTLDGVAGDFAAGGFDTAFALGTDPSVDHLRPYLRAAGFRAVVEPPLDAALPGSGWGIPDGRTLTLLRNWIEERRVADASKPYFAVFQSLSTRPPHALPDDYARVHGDADAWSRHLDAVSYLDAELGRFYDWYVEHEAPRGTVLVIAGANPAPLAAPGDPPPTVPGSYEPRFGVPLILAGLEGEESEAARLAAARPGSHVDLPQTLLGLVGSDTRGCYQGRDLLDQEAAEWPLDRLVISVGGPRRELLFVRHGSHRWMFGAQGSTPTLFDEESDPLLRRNLFAEDDHELPVMRDLVSAYRAIDNYLRRENGYRPPRAPGARTPIEAPTASLLVSSGGQFRGAEGGAALPPNSVPAVGQAIDAGFPWIAVDVQVTQDGVAMIAGRTVLDLGNLNLPGPMAHLTRRAMVPWSAVTSAQARQLRLPHETLAATLARARGRAGLILTIAPDLWSPERVRMLRSVLTAAAQAPAGSRLMIRSSDLSVLATAHALTSVPTVLTSGGRAVDRRLLDFLAEEGVDVLDLSTPILAPGLLADAHARGLRVMAPGASTARGDLVPDFILGPNLAPPVASE